jgi:hypothetical protein
MEPVRPTNCDPRQSLRSGIAFGTLILLCAGGCRGDPVSSPDLDYTLTVLGEGFGSGHVGSSSGTNPPLDCTIVEGLTTSGCAEFYPWGTVVTLIVTPAPGYDMDPWSGDAASCAAARFCSITIDESRVAVATFVPDLTIASANFHIDPDFRDISTIIWVFDLPNTTDQTVELAKVRFTSWNASRTALDSGFAYVGPIPPGESRASISFTDHYGTEAGMAVEVVGVRYTAEDPGFGRAQIVSSTWRVEPDSEMIAWSVEVANTTNDELPGVKVDFSTYDSNDRIVGYHATSIGPIPPGESRSSERVTERRGGEASARFRIADIYSGELPT